MIEPLAGVTVLDLTRLVPGPFCGWLLRCWGARVVKVEDTGSGDYLRDLLPPWFRQLNAGAESVALNLKHPAGRAVLLRLLSQADMVLEGFRPGVMERLGLDFETLRAANPRVVLVSLSGFGADEDRAGHDLTYQARSGLLSLMSEPPPVQWADMAGGLTAAAGALAALAGARATGRGVHVRTSLLEALLGMGSLLGAQAQAGERLERGQMPLVGALPCYDVYATADGGRVALGALEPKFWQAFCMAVGRPDWHARGGDPHMHAELTALFASRPLAAWAALAAETDCCLEPVRPLAEAVQGLGGFQPVSFDGHRPESRGPVPARGAATRDFLSAAGFSEQEIEALAAEAVIATT
ncbi:MAG TPA: CaiB/BaiF CoA-transferase family protein [Symbiobacteriaceae bacterium]|jgi:crotonobetainyl-CoA:carnitine CoA-transferase CaiB-like acyl-CoA transferase